MTQLGEQANTVARNLYSYGHNERRSNKEIELLWVVSNFTPEISFSKLNRKTVRFVPFVPFQGENVRAVHGSLYRQKLASKLGKLNVHEV